MRNTIKMKFGIFMTVILSMLIHGVAKAGVLNKREIRCHTHNREKDFTFGDKFLTFQEQYKKTDFNSKRIISSAVQLKSKPVGKGVIQTMSFEGQKHKVYIKDLSKFDEIHDFLSITSAQGHEMTYPLECSYID